MTNPVDRLLEAYKPLVDTMAARLTDERLPYPARHRTVKRLSEIDPSKVIPELVESARIARSTAESYTVARNLATARRLDPTFDPFDVLIGPSVSLKTRAYVASLIAREEPLYFETHLPKLLKSLDGDDRGRIIQAVSPFAIANDDEQVKSMTTSRNANTRAAAAAIWMRTMYESEVRQLAERVSTYERSRTGTREGLGVIGKRLRSITGKRLIPDSLSPLDVTNALRYLATSPEQTWFTSVAYAALGNHEFDPASRREAMTFLTRQPMTRDQAHELAEVLAERALDPQEDPHVRNMALVGLRTIRVAPKADLTPLLSQREFFVNAICTLVVLDIDGWNKRKVADEIMSLSSPPYLPTGEPQLAQALKIALADAREDDPSLRFDVLTDVVADLQRRIEKRERISPSPILDFGPTPRALAVIGYANTSNAFDTLCKIGNLPAETQPSGSFFRNDTSISSGVLRALSHLYDDRATAMFVSVFDPLGGEASHQFDRADVRAALKLYGSSFGKPSAEGRDAILRLIGNHDGLGSVASSNNLRETAIDTLAVAHPQDACDYYDRLIRQGGEVGEQALYELASLRNLLNSGFTRRRPAVDLNGPDFVNRDPGGPTFA